MNNKITAQGLALFAPGVEPSFRNDKNKKPNPAAFKRFLLQAKAYVDSHPGQPKLITINAWNEWSEGSHLEPDKEHGYGYLDAVKEVFGKN